jgi:hypothetical protein
LKRTGIERDLLARLRERAPGKSDRELVEGSRGGDLGFKAIHRVQRRTADAGWTRGEKAKRCASDASAAAAQPGRLRLEASRSRPQRSLSALVGNLQAAPAALLEAVH